MDYDPNPPGGSSYDFNQYNTAPQSSFDQQFAQAERRGDNSSQGMAIGSMVIGIVGFFFYAGLIIPYVSMFICGLTMIMAIIGIVLAAVAMKKMSSTGNKSGFGFAIAGLVLNIVQGIISLIGVGMIILVLAFAVSIGAI